MGLSSLGATIKVHHPFLIGSDKLHGGSEAIPTPLLDASESPVCVVSGFATDCRFDGCDLKTLW